MNIIKKEILEFNEREIDAIRLVKDICAGLNREATDPSLKKLANEIYGKIVELGRWEE